MLTPQTSTSAPESAERAQDARKGGCPPRMAGCRRQCLHRQDVQAYRAARAAAEALREQTTYGYATESAEYGRILDFKAWLLAKAGRAAA